MARIISISRKKQFYYHILGLEYQLLIFVYSDIKRSGNSGGDGDYLSCRVHEGITCRGRNPRGNFTFSCCYSYKVVPCNLASVSHTYDQIMKINT